MTSEQTQSAKPESLARKMGIGAAWVTGLRFAVRFLGFISTIILARLLAPADFGLVALATMIAASLEMLSAFNFNIWLVRHPDPAREHYDTVWTLSVLRGVATAGVMVLLAAPLAAFFDEAGLASVLMVLAAGQVIVGLTNTGVVDFQKYLKFHKEFQMLVSARVGTFVVTVTLALALRSHWALVAGIVTGQVLNLALSYLLHPFRPQMSLSRWRDVFDFSKWILAGSLGGFLYRRMDTFFIGKLLSSQSLGLYSVAKEIADLASTEIVMPLRRVLLPGYAQMNNDSDRMRDGFVDGFALILLVGAPVAAGIALLADPLVRLLLGAQWLASIPLVEILALYALTAIAAANQVPVLLAMGRTRTLAALTALGVVILLPALTWGVVRFEAAGAAAIVSAVNALVVGVGLVVVARALNLRFASLFGQVWPTLIGLLIMTFAVHRVVSPMHASGTAAFLQLAAGFAVGATVYTLTGLAIWHLRGRPAGPERRILDQVDYWRARKRDSA